MKKRFRRLRTRGDEAYQVYEIAVGGVYRDKHGDTFIISHQTPKAGLFVGITPEGRRRFFSASGVERVGGRLLRWYSKTGPTQHQLAVSEKLENQERDR